MLHHSVDTSTILLCRNALGSTPGQYTGIFYIFFQICPTEHVFAIKAFLLYTKYIVVSFSELSFCVPSLVIFNGTTYSVSPTFITLCNNHVCECVSIHFLTDLDIFHFSSYETYTTRILQWLSGFPFLAWIWHHLSFLVPTWRLTTFCTFPSHSQPHCF